MANNENKSEKRNLFVRFFGTLGRWFGRMFMGASKSLATEDALAVEALESPSRMAVRTFFRRKLAVTALVVLVALFLLVFIGPLFLPMDLNFTDAGQANIAPVMSMRSVPAKLKNQIASMSSFSNYSLGVGEDHTLYMWGYTKDALLGIDYSDYPDEIRDGNVLMAAAGSDFVIAVTT